MHVCVCVCVLGFDWWPHIYRYMYVCMYVYVYVYWVSTGGLISAFRHACIHTYTHTHIEYLLFCLCVCVCTCTHVKNECINGKLTLATTDLFIHGNYSLSGSYIHTNACIFCTLQWKTHPRDHRLVHARMTQPYERPVFLQDQDLCIQRKRK